MAASVDSGDACPAAASPRPICRSIQVISRSTTFCVVLRAQQLALQPGPCLARRRVERRIGGRGHGAEERDHDAVIPACVISSTS